MIVAMSGGVDSSVAALLLKKQGYDVIGIYMKNWSDPTGLTHCPWEEDLRDAQAVSHKLKIPFYAISLEKEYKKMVFDYMIAEYKAGRTPNPDIMCNKKIKFDLFLQKAKTFDADFMATGHYIRKLKTKDKKQKTLFKLLKAKDKNKDQSYFLYVLTQKQLKQCLFPIGDYTKPLIRQIAKKAGLPNWQKKESQGLCFIGQVDFRKFLTKWIKTKPGKIITTDGQTIGQHRGIAFYTIGQKAGIGGKGPYYVTKIDAKKNLVYVTNKKNDPALFGRELIAIKINWIAGHPPKLPAKVQAKIRYRTPDASTIIKTVGKLTGKSDPQIRQVKVIFAKSQRAITPGQSVVFYKGEEMLGGGVIV